MGVDFQAYSNLRTEPLPIEYRITHRSWTAKEKQEFNESISQAPPDICSLILAMNGVSTSPSGEYVFPAKSTSNEEMRESVYEYYESKPDFINICWLTNTVYYKTPATQEYSCGRSYSGYGEFTQLLAKLNNGKQLTMPHSYTTGDDLIGAAECRQTLEDLKELRDHFVEDSWEPDATKEDEDESKDKHEESWFFKQFYTLISLAAECGLLCVF